MIYIKSQVGWLDINSYGKTIVYMRKSLMPRWNVLSYKIMILIAVRTENSVKNIIEYD